MNGFMSKTKQNIYGLERGKVGNRVAVVLDGQQVYKGLYAPSNPRTEKQQRHRAKLAFANRLSAALAEAVNVGYAMVPEEGSMQSARNAFVKANWDNGSLVWDGERGEWTLDAGRLLVAQGPLATGQGFGARVARGWLRITCADNELGARHAAEDDELMVAAYWPEAQGLVLYRGPQRLDCAECAFELPKEAEGVPVVWVWFRAARFHRGTVGKATLRPGQCSASMVLETGN